MPHESNFSFIIFLYFYLHFYPLSPLPSSFFFSFYVLPTFISVCFLSSTCLVFLFFSTSASFGSRAFACFYAMSQCVQCTVLAQCQLQVEQKTNTTHTFFHAHLQFQFLAVRFLVCLHLIPFQMQTKD
jgi:hypothetical protein